MFCTNCGFKLNKENAFCPSCGTKREVENSSTTVSDSSSIHYDSELTLNQQEVEPNTIVEFSSEEPLQPNIESGTERGTYNAPEELNSKPDNFANKPLWVKISIASVLIFLVVIFVFVSVQASPVNKYKRAFKDEDLSRMNSIYIEHIRDSETSLEKIINYLEAEAENVIDRFENEKIIYAEAYDQLQFIYSSNMLSHFYLDDVWQRLNYAYEARSNYEQGKEALDSENYQDAIIYLSQISSESSYYEKAKKDLFVAREAYRDQVLASVDDFVKDNDLDSAIYVLNNAISRYLSEDIQIIQRNIEVMALHEENKIKEVIEQARSFSEPSDSLNRLREARNTYPDNKSLEKEFDKYLELYIDNLINYASGLVEQGNLSGAIDFFNGDFAFVSSDDPRIETVRSGYIETYVGKVIDESEVKFQEEKDYEGAFSVINSAVALLPDNQELQDKKAELTDRMPIFLSDMDYFDKNINMYINDFSEMKDNLGNEYITSMDFSNGEYVEYFLNNQYKNISGVVAVPFSSRDKRGEGEIEIYGDNILLFKSDRFKRGSLPQEFNLDITGIEMLRIEHAYYDDGLFYYPFAVIWDVVLTK